MIGERALSSAPGTHVAQHRAPRGVPPQNPVQRTIVYYHGSRTHLALGKDTPYLRKRESNDGGKIVALPMVGGLHHRYTRRAA
jgi:hypothetical protein